MSELNVSLHPFHPKQQEVFQNDKRFRILNWGRRTGKSIFAIVYTTIMATQKTGRYWVIAPTYQQAKNIYWRDVILRFIPKELIAKKNETELIITLINGSIIELKGADNPDSLRGSGIAGVVLDEYAFMKANVFDEIIRPMIADSQGWAIFISTPNGFNHFYDLCESAEWGKHKDWMYSHATMYDNPFINRDEIEEIKSKTDEDTFAREYLADFRQPKGLVYKTFDSKVHVVAPEEVPENGTYALGIDFGFTNPLAAVFVKIDYDDNWWVYDEVYSPGLNTEQAVKAIKDKMGTNHFTYIIGDAQAAQEIANFKMHGLHVNPCREKGKGSILSGIRQISDMLKIQGNGKPKLFISSAAKNILYEFQTYAYPDNVDGKNAQEQPQKLNDHALDALRYLKLSVYARQNIRIHKPPTQKLRLTRKR